MAMSGASDMDTQEDRLLLASTLLLYAAAEKFAEKSCAQCSDGEMAHWESVLLDAATSFVLTFLEVLKRDRPDLTTADSRIDFLRDSIVGHEEKLSIVAEKFKSEFLKSANESLTCAHRIEKRE